MMKTSRFWSLPTIGLIGLMIGATLYFAFTYVAKGQWKDVLRADLFELVDSRGVSRARLGLSGGDQSYTYLNLMDRSGKIRFQIVVYPDRRPPTAELLSAGGKVVANLAGSSKPAASGLPPLKHVPAPSGKSTTSSAKSDDLSSADFANLQNQIDVLRASLNKVSDRVNDIGQ